MHATHLTKEETIGHIPNDPEKINLEALETTLQYYQAAVENMTEKKDQDLMLPVVDFINHIKSQLPVDVN